MKYESEIVRAPIIIIDANLPMETLNLILKLAGEHKIPIKCLGDDFIGYPCCCPCENLEIDAYGDECIESGDLGDCLLKRFC
ncbi:YeiC-like protein [Sarcoptes scabiei]|uniref:YeiC-like protein n=1 Tax=Sarcoptes scabiei TaxID=52283 RepID=A0A131ZYQ0_SARSC|nr:YeiC-like protein [Sarcoptes scabiei]